MVTPSRRLRSAGAALTMLWGCGMAEAVAPQIRTRGPGFHRIMLGDFDVTALLDGAHPFPVYKVLQREKPKGTAPLSATNSGETDALLAAVDLGAPPEVSINAFLINTGSQLVRIDGGAGALYGACCGHLLDNLRDSGYRPEQVDAALLTHMHADRVGGVMAAGGAAFPNAVVRVSRREANHWLDVANEAKAPALLLPMSAGVRKSLKPSIDAARFAPFDEGATLFPGIRALPTWGHTPSHSSYIVEGHGEKLLVWGDIVHVAPVQFRDPRVTVTYDSGPRSAGRQRDALFAEAAQSHGWIGAAQTDACAGRPARRRKAGNNGVRPRVRSLPERDRPIPSSRAGMSAPVTPRQPSASPPTIGRPRGFWRLSPQSWTSADALIFAGRRRPPRDRFGAGLPGTRSPLAPRAYRDRTHHERGAPRIHRSRRRDPR
jgi:glyoxylase-like metal-dependent hydrolase (beta-lactamase superfamily II)